MKRTMVALVNVRNSIAEHRLDPRSRDFVWNRHKAVRHRPQSWISSSGRRVRSISPEIRCDPLPFQLIFTCTAFRAHPWFGMRRNTTHSVEKKYAGRNQGRLSPHDFGIRPAITAPRARVSSFSTAVESTDGIAYSYAAPKITTCENSRETHTHVSRTHRGSSNQIPARHFPLLRVIQAPSLCYSHSPRRGTTFTALNNRFHLRQVRFPAIWKL